MMVGVIIGILFSIPILGLFLLTCIIMYSFGVPVAQGAFSYFLYKRNRYRYIQYLERNKLELLKLLVAKKMFAMAHAKDKKEQILVEK